MVKEVCFLPLKTRKAPEIQGLQRKSLYNRADRRVYHQFRKELHIIKAERFVYHHCESKIQPSADDMHLR